MNHHTLLKTCSEMELIEPSLTGILFLWWTELPSLGGTCLCSHLEAWSPFSHSNCSVIPAHFLCCEPYALFLLCAFLGYSPTSPKRPLFWPRPSDRNLICSLPALRTTNSPVLQVTLAQTRAQCSEQNLSNSLAQRLLWNACSRTTEVISRKAFVSKGGTWDRHDSDEVVSAHGGKLRKRFSWGSTVYFLAPDMYSMHKQK